MMRPAISTSTLSLPDAVDLFGTAQLIHDKIALRVA